MNGKKKSVSEVPFTTRNCHAFWERLCCDWKSRINARRPHSPTRVSQTSHTISVLSPLCFPLCSLNCAFHYASLTDDCVAVVSMTQIYIGKLPISYQIFSRPFAFISSVKYCWAPARETWLTQANFFLKPVLPDFLTIVCHHLRMHLKRWRNSGLLILPRKWTFASGLRSRNGLTSNRW